MKSAAKRARKRHVQQELFRRGGKRKGAGRKPKGARAGAKHAVRPAVKPSDALHVVMRVVPAVGNMRRRAMYKAMREATIAAALRERFRIVHISLQRTHVHMIVEAATKEALARGMQAFQISAARNINTVLSGKYGRRRGKVFADRYHVEVIKSPTRARRALLYVTTGESTRRTSKGWQARGWSTLSRREFCFGAGKSSRTRTSCGQYAKAMIRCSCEPPKAGYSARAGNCVDRYPHGMCQASARDAAGTGTLAYLLIRDRLVGHRHGGLVFEVTRGGALDDGFGLGAAFANARSATEVVAVDGEYRWRTALGGDDDRDGRTNDDGAAPGPDQRIAAQLAAGGRRALLAFGDDGGGVVRDGAARGLPGFAHGGGEVCAVAEADLDERGAARRCAGAALKDQRR